MADSIPIPDPTARTLETVHREVGVLGDMVEAKLEGLENTLALRLELIHAVPGLIKDAIDHTKELSALQFGLTEVHRVERENFAEAHRLELKSDNQKTVETAMTAAEKAVQAALAAAEKAATKSEIAFTKALDQVTDTFKAAIAASTTQIDDLKIAANSLTQASFFGKDNRINQRLDGTFILQAVTIAVAIYLGTRR